MILDSKYIMGITWSGATVSAGTVVYKDGMTFSQLTDAISSEDTIGITQKEMGDGDFGYIGVGGIITMDTSDWEVGDILNLVGSTIDNYVGNGDYLIHIGEVLSKSVIGSVKFDPKYSYMQGYCTRYQMYDNPTETIISTQSFWTKISGTTSNGSFTNRFDLSNNRATYTGNTPLYFEVSCGLSLHSGNNLKIKSVISKNGIGITSSQTSVVTTGTGNNMHITNNDIVRLSSGDYIEIMVLNDTSTAAIHVEDLNVVIKKIY